MGLPPRRRPNAEVRGREHLTPKEVERVRKAALKLGRGANGHRDATMILVAYRHGLRAAELVGLRWDQVDLAEATLHVRRRKRGSPGTHPMERDEVAALRKLEGDRRGIAFVFLTERGGPVATREFHRVVARAGQKCGIAFPIHPHMLRHAAGFKLANDGHDTRVIQAYLGHKNIQHTVRYTDMAPGRFKQFRWKD